MSGPEDSTEDKGARDELADAIRALRRLRNEELQLLRLIELALRKASVGHPESEEIPEDSPAELPGWISEEVDSVLSEAFDTETSSPDDPSDGDESFNGSPSDSIAVSPGLSSYLLLGSGHEWVCFPWETVVRVDLHDASAGAVAGQSLREILGQGDTPDRPDVFCIRFATGLGRISCQSVGGVVTLDEAARRGVECVLIPEISGNDGGAKVSLKPLLEVAALEARTQVAGMPRKRKGNLLDSLPDESTADNTRFEGPRQDPGDVLPSEQTDSGESADELAFDVGPDRDSEVSATPTEDSTPPISPMDSIAPGMTPSGAVPTGLVAVRYLPARVGITRALRSRGWFLRETADLSEVPPRLQKICYRAAFIEMVDDEIPDIIPALRTAVANGCRVIAVGSRLRGRASNSLWELGEIPRLLYPFHESEIERLLDDLCQTPPN